MAKDLRMLLLMVVLAAACAVFAAPPPIRANDEEYGCPPERRQVWQLERERLERLKGLIESPYYDKELPPAYYFYERRFFFGHPYYGYLYPYGCKYPFMYWSPYGYRWPQTDPYDYFAVPDYIYPEKFFGYPPSYYRDHCREEDAN